MEIKYDDKHILDVDIDVSNVTDDKIRMSGFGVNNEGGAIACAEFSTADRSKVMYIGLWAQKAFVIRMDDMRDPFFTYFTDYLGAPILAGEEDHGISTTKEQEVKQLRDGGV